MLSGHGAAPVECWAALLRAQRFAQVTRRASRAAGGAGGGRGAARGSRRCDGAGRRRFHGRLAATAQLLHGGRHGNTRAAGRRLTSKRHGLRPYARGFIAGARNAVQSTADQRSSGLAYSWSTVWNQGTDATKVTTDNTALVTAMVAKTRERTARSCCGFFNAKVTAHVATARQTSGTTTDAICTGVALKVRW